MFHQTGVVLCKIKRCSSASENCDTSVSATSRKNDDNNENGGGDCCANVDSACQGKEYKSSLQDILALTSDRT